MENYQQDLMNIMVKKVLSKHNAKPATDLSDEEKEKVKKVVGEIQAEVEKFLENQNKVLSEEDFEQGPVQNSNDEAPTNSVIEQSLEKMMNSNNDVKQVKTFFNKDEE
ncbi:hypothetical protein JCM9140_746 [Halalkalibacter wakoensis JCM 9140]|uniref:Uncharacterized protein n=1 Tax=Halalkalibacter wakoensis JCM 9140 TaxID=1236970 RepID=W4Q089_9BACI|nr:hypothetical protein [Halalkalibacter wakoensis]GAE24794.1 hypothetical protein JCM9140_746 [Halalkalibacter wakoensis JCM 9140]